MPVPVIGLLDQRSPDELAGRLRGFRQGLRELGFVEGENVAIEYRWAENKMERLPELAADLLRRQVSVIAATSGTSPALAAKAATTTIPIVFIVSNDPVRLGLVASIARPDGNLTGINFFTGELAAKRLELLHELVPAATRLAVLIDPANPDYAETTVRDIGAAARAIGLQVQVVNASTVREINAAFATFVRERPDALFVGHDPFFNSRRAAILVTSLVVAGAYSHAKALHVRDPEDLALAYLLPTIFIAVFFGSTLAVATSFGSGLAAAYLIYPPQLSVWIEDANHVAELGFILLLAITASKAVGVIIDGKPLGSSAARAASRRT
jgi:hypothetical protein